ncbi:MAG: HAD family hydrolase [Acidobacteria bacterium]|nr:MAG: HAD family hydrolase [Acidobacteriota bacterium]
MIQTRAVFFDVDFTLIYPGPAFQGEGYREFCGRHGMDVDPDRFPAAVVSASHILDREQDAIYDPQIFIDYTAHIIEAMGGRGAAVEPCAVEIYREWAACQHFRLYDDVPAALEALADKDILVGLISNSHRSLESFQEHFELDGLIDVAISSSEHGYMKPHPSIFEAALKLAGVSAGDAMMVGDSLTQDIEGARRVGMRGVLVRRADAPAAQSDAGVTVIRSLLELPNVL